MAELTEDDKAYEEIAKSNLDQAVKICQTRADLNNRQANRYFLILLILIAVVIAATFVLSYSSLQSDKIPKLYEASTISNNQALELSNKLKEQIQLEQKSLRALTDSMYKNESFDRAQISAISKQSINSLIGFGESVDAVLHEIDTANSSRYTRSRDLSNLSTSTSGQIPTVLYYFIYAIFILLIILTSSFYRYHLKEASKFDYLLLGFIRIRIAGSYSKTGFEDVVKSSLAVNAFNFDPGSKKTFESPFPGHPAVDLLSEVLDTLTKKFNMTSKD